MDVHSITFFFPSSTNYGNSMRFLQHCSLDRAGGDNEVHCAACTDTMLLVLD
jgi:hypothetical protein